MSTRPIRAAVAIACLSVAFLSRGPVVGAHQEVLTNDALVQMVIAKVAKELLLSKIHSVPNTFDISVHGLVSLSTNKVPADVIKAAMLRVTKDQANARKEVLTNSSVVEMVNGKVARDVIIMKIHSTTSAFDLTAGGLVGLQQNKVHQEIVKAMMATSIITETDLASELNNTGSVSLYGIQFDTGDATIKGESADVLAPVGAMLKSQPALKLEIQGHTDNVGAPAANLKLSQQRALAVKTYLVQTFGIAATRLTAVGFGDTKPVGDNATDDGRTKNRRVELVKK